MHRFFKILKYLIEARPRLEIFIHYFLSTLYRCISETFSPSSAFITMQGMYKAQTTLPEMYKAQNNELNEQ